MFCSLGSDVTMRWSRDVEHDASASLGLCSLTLWSLTSLSLVQWRMAAAICDEHCSVRANCQWLSATSLRCGSCDRSRKNWRHALSSSTQGRERLADTSRDWRLHQEQSHQLYRLAATWRDWRLHPGQSHQLYRLADTSRDWRLHQGQSHQLYSHYNTSKLIITSKIVIKYIVYVITYKIIYVFIIYYIKTSYVI